MTTWVWGELADGRQVHAHRVRSPELELTVLEWGATVHALAVDRRGVVLGHPDLGTYLRSDAYIGATVGRYANRIAGGRFAVDGVSCSVPQNDRGNNLHGGPDGFDRQLWTTRAVTASVAELGLVSPAGHQGFPGRVEAVVRFAVHGREVRVEHRASTDAPTPVAMTNHSYFNLGTTPTVEDHELTVHASAYTPVDGTGIPTGVAPVDGTVFDLRRPTRLGTLVRDPALAGTGGLDHNLAVDGTGLREVAVLAADGLAMTVLSDQPGLQVYTGNKLDGTLRGTGGAAYGRWAGVALEAQAFPDSPNRPEFGDVVLRPGEEYRATTVWRFA